MALNIGSGGRPRWFLFLAVLFGILAAALAWYGLQQSAGQQAKSSSRVTIVVARQDIPPRTLITNDMVELKDVSQDAVAPAAVPELASVVGHSVRQTVYKGEQVLYTRLFAERAEAGLAFTIPQGKRAVSVSTSETMGSGGLILPGDHVDVLAVCKASVQGASQPAPGGGTTSYTEQLKAATVLQDVEILAVAQQLAGVEPTPSAVQQATGSAASSKEAPRANPQPLPAARSVTLAVEIAQAQRLILFANLCDLSLATRRFDDRGVQAVPPDELNFGIAR